MYKPIKKGLRNYISPGLIFGSLRYIIQQVNPPSQIQYGGFKGKREKFGNMIQQGLK